MRQAGRATGGHRVAIGSNPERNRSHNRRVVLDVVRVHGPVGRTRIAELAHLTPQAVANIVEELVAERFLVEVGRLRRGRGQPPIQFAVNPDGPVTIGVEIAADHVVTVALDLAGGLRAQRVSALEDTIPEVVLPRVAAEIAALEAALLAGAAADAAPPDVLGVGVVMPGPFEIEGMTSVGPTTLSGWGGIAPGPALSQAVGRPVVVENDATAAAVGERLFGAGRHVQTFCLLYFGAGLGLGIIHEGRPYRGAFGNAGEIGHAVVAPGGRACQCGQRGCLEQYASLQALRERLAANAVPAPDAASLERLLADGDPTLSAWIREAAAHLAPMIATLENILDPETIVFGGVMPDALTDALIAALDPLPVSVASRRARAMPRVVRGQTGQLTAALGAASLPVLDTLTPKLDTASAAASRATPR
ncbi:ROK family protein [Salinarimonas ramus]|uniref:Sugar kinase n=1 Tax=Salinarimonas ramus TaxID=690164 RepID=A0A917QBD2_9HYPH|nr:ROK family protein [Salinarimonas ramus]GGK41319.1 sugar kinase [Salinarimonas ramus]